MKLQVPFIKQDQGSVDCGLAMVVMILQYYGITKTLTEIEKEIPVFEIGTYAPQLGIYLLEQGFEVEIITMQPWLFTQQHKYFSQEKILKYLETRVCFLNPSLQRGLRFFSDFLKKGGKLRVKVPDLEDIFQEIREKRPVGALLTTGFMDGSKSFFNFHYNLITGFDGKYLLMHDPALKAFHKRLPADFLYGLYATAHKDVDNGCLLLCKPKEASATTTQP